MITLHHLEYSQSFRILWLLEELGVQYKLELYERDKISNLAPSSYKAISPLGTAPVISDGDMVLSESNAIIDYILDKYPNESLRPNVNSEYRTQYLFWLHASQGSLMPVLLITMLFRVIPEKVPFFIRPIIKPIFNLAKKSFTEPRLDALLQQAEAALGQSEWFGGNELTAADISMCYPMESMQSNGYINADYPNCLAWIERAKAHESYQRALAKDGKGSIVFSL